MRKWTIFALAVGACAVMLWAVDPAQTWWAPKCVFHSLTGWSCPGCGLQRAAHALLHGDVARAWAYNYFFIVSLPYLGVVLLFTLWPALGRRWPRVRAFCMGMPMALIYVVLFMAWWVVRNLLNV